MKAIILPGMDGTGKLLEPFSDALREHGMVSSIMSYPDHQAQSYQKLIEKVIVPALPLKEDYILIAESYSGPMAIALSQKKPPGLKGLVLVVTFAEPPDSILLSVTKVLPMKSILSLPVPCWMAHRLMLGKRQPRGDQDVFCQVVREMRPEVIAARIENVRSIVLEKNPITLPAIYIRALEDHLLPSNAVEGVRALVPDLQVHEIPGPHLVLDTSPELCAAITAGFVKKIENPSVS